MSRNRTIAGNPAAGHIIMKDGPDAIDTQNTDVGVLDKEIVLEGDMSLDDLRDSLNNLGSVHVSDPAFRKFTQDLLFYEQEVLICITPSADKNAEKIIDVYNGGTPQRLIRGHWTKVKRKYVEVLARAKPYGVSTPEIVDGNGNRTTKIETTTGLRYPFEMKDPNPVGQAWLQSILQEA